ncbi:hypothetical protein A0H81_05681 [Grifola frondosa]|uniref:Uncharacterized protein n=1 Tax=Grifola frondosa TaxID=5627 RepID=A0A1C7MBX5_GRIFR|nr:hypothetical protein A0H81_05681 [Grifola frondosa]
MRKGSETVVPKVWLLRLWLRTIAVQCCDDQPLIDKVMPICFKTFGGKSFDNARDQMSLIAASDKADERADPCSVKSIARNHHSIRCVMDLPWIAVTFDMGVKESVVCSTFSTSRLDNVNANVTEYTSDEEETSEDGILEDEFEEDAPDEALCLRIYASGMSAQTFLFLAELPGLEHILNDIVRRAMGPPHPLPIQQRLADVMQFGETSEEDHMAWEYGKQDL